MNVKCVAILHPQDIHYSMLKKKRTYKVDFVEKKSITPYHIS